MNKYGFIHFVGIGGISMSGIAKIMLNRGVMVSGSDTGDNKEIRELKSLGAIISKGQSADNIKNQDLVVYTAAVKQDNPELVAAREKGIETVNRATMLGWIMKDYANAISVAGTHGKTTTTSMLACILVKAMLDPTVMVGGELDFIGGNFRMGSSEWFITESCEYCRSFLKFFPKIALILNIEEDHLDYYKDINDIISAFSDFAALVPKDGAVIALSGSENVKKAVQGAKGKVYTFGLKDADFVPEHITYSHDGCASFDVRYKGDRLVSVSLFVPGEHNVLNAVAAVAAAYVMNIKMEYVKDGLEAFKGTHRRFERKGTLNGALVVDDYSHHPTEIRAMLAAAAKVEHNKLWCVFQPHTYTRTYTLFDEFVDALSGAGNVILADIYAAREKDTGLVSSAQLAEKIPGAMYMKDFGEIEDYLRRNVSEGDLVVTVGAGNVVQIAEDITK